MTHQDIAKIVLEQRNRHQELLMKCKSAPGEAAMGFGPPKKLDILDRALEKHRKIHRRG